MEDSSSDVMKKAVLRTILDGGENEFLKFENSEEMKSKRIRRHASRLFQLEFTSKESLEELMCAGEDIIGIMDDDGTDFGSMS